MDLVRYALGRIGLVLDLFDRAERLVAVLALRHAVVVGAGRVAVTVLVHRR